MDEGGVNLTPPTHDQQQFWQTSLLLFPSPLTETQGCYTGVYRAWANSDKMSGNEHAISMLIVVSKTGLR